jgi:hypothetical protein
VTSETATTTTAARINRMDVLTTDLLKTGSRE